MAKKIVVFHVLAQKSEGKPEILVKDFLWDSQANLHALMGHWWETQKADGWQMTRDDGGYITGHWLLINDDLIREAAHDGR